MTNSTENTTVEYNKAKKSDVWKIDPRALVIEEGFNTRKEMGDISELARSIEVNGLKVPVRVHRDGEKYIVTDGHRRTLAIQELLKRNVEIARIPAIVTRKQSTEERIIEILLTNSGKPLTPIEQGNTYLKLLNFGWDAKEISERTGKSEENVKNNIFLVQGSTKETRKFIEEKSISATTARQILKSEVDPDVANAKIKELVETAKSEGKKKVKCSDVAKPAKKEVVTNDFNATEETYTKDDVKRIILKHLGKVSGKFNGKQIFDFSSVDEIKSIILNATDIEF